MQIKKIIPPLAVLTILIIVLAVFLSFNPDAAKAKSSTGASSALIKKGQYLVNLGGCNDCHSPKVFTNIGPEPDTTRLLSGYPANSKLPEVDLSMIGPDKWGGLCTNDLTGWVGPWGASFTANLTPDATTGIGLWTQDMFVKAMRTGKHMGAGRPILPPMPWQNFAHVSDEDLAAIFAYLKSLKPIKNRVPVPIVPEDLAKQGAAKVGMSK
jgi:cytochrome c553